MHLVSTNIHMGPIVDRVYEVIEVRAPSQTSHPAWIWISFFLDLDLLLLKLKREVHSLCTNSCSDRRDFFFNAREKKKISTPLISSLKTPSWILAEVWHEKSIRNGVKRKEGLRS